MYTTALIRRHVVKLPKDRIFTTRDVLIYGKRATVDQALHRLVKSQIIIRLSWGVFVKYGSKIPPIADIAFAKAKAFGKDIGKHGKTIIIDQKDMRHTNPHHAQGLSDRTTGKPAGEKLVSEKIAQGMIEQSMIEQAIAANTGRNRVIHKVKTTICSVVFAVNGRSSSFRIGNLKVKLLGVSARKMELSKSKIGQVSLALWTQGKHLSLHEQKVRIAKATRAFCRSEREFIKQSAALLPAWLADPWFHVQFRYS